MRKGFKIAALLAGLLIAAILVAVAAIAWDLRTVPPNSALPQMTQNLPYSAADAQRVFHTRVQLQFPDGIAADTLASELTQAGFKLVPSRMARDHYSAFAEQHGGLCVRSWSIIWVRDPLGAARGIDAIFRLNCP